MWNPYLKLEIAQIHQYIWFEHESKKEQGNANYEESPSMARRKNIGYELKLLIYAISILREVQRRCKNLLSSIKCNTAI